MLLNVIRSNHHPFCCRFASKSAAIAIYTLAGFSLLGTLGVDTKPLVAGLGVGGFTVGFALRVGSAAPAIAEPICTGCCLCKCIAWDNNCCMREHLQQ